MAGYEVVPGALRKSQQTWDFCVGSWSVFGQGLQAAHLADGGMGLIGRMAGFPGDYNAAVAQIEEKVQRSIVELERTSDALNGVAKEYEAKDEEYYAEFGWIGNDLDEPGGGGGGGHGEPRDPGRQGGERDPEADNAPEFFV